MYAFCGWVVCDYGGLTSQPRVSVAGVRGCAVYPLWEFFV